MPIIIDRNWSYTVDLVNASYEHNFKGSIFQLAAEQLYARKWNQLLVKQF
jgi:hypothetical protein